MRRVGQPRPLPDGVRPRIRIHVEIAQVFIEPRPNVVADVRDRVGAPAEQFAALRPANVPHPLREGVNFRPLGGVRRQEKQLVDPAAEVRRLQRRRRGEPPRDQTQHESCVVGVEGAAVRRQGVAFAQPLVSRPGGLEARVRRFWCGYAPVGEVCGGGVAQRFVRVHPGVEHGAGQWMVAPFDGVQDRPQKSLVGRPARVAESVQVEMADTGVQLLADTRGCGAMLQGACHDVPAELYAQQPEDLVR